MRETATQRAAFTEAFLRGHPHEEIMYTRRCVESVGEDVPSMAETLPSVGKTMSSVTETLPGVMELCGTRDALRSTRGSKKWAPTGHFLLYIIG